KNDAHRPAVVGSTTPPVAHFLNVQIQLMHSINGLQCPAIDTRGQRIIPGLQQWERHDEPTIEHDKSPFPQAFRPILRLSRCCLHAEDLLSKHSKSPPNCVVRPLNHK